MAKSRPEPTSVWRVCRRQLRRRRQLLLSGRIAGRADSIDVGRRLDSTLLESTWRGELEARLDQWPGSD